jgi:tetratricopeptide (TPR) repeat protein
VPDAEDAGETKRKAYETLVRAGVRATSLGAAAEARRYFEDSAALTGNPSEQAGLLARAGEMAGRTGDPEGARQLLDRAIALYETEGDTHSAARTWARWSQFLGFTGHRDEGLERLEQAFEVIVRDEPDEDLAVVAAQLSRVYWFTGELERASERAELALDIAEAQGLPTPLTIALRAKSAVLESRGHSAESFALLKQSLEVALEHDLLEDASTCYFILSDSRFRGDRYAEALRYLDESLAFASRVGSRRFEWGIQAERTYALLMLGRWDEVLATADTYTEEQVHSGGVVLGVLQSGVDAHCQRGELDAARRIFDMFSWLRDSTDVQDQGIFLAAAAALRRAEGRLEEALAAGAATIETASTLGPAFQGVKHGVVMRSRRPLRSVTQRRPRSFLSSSRTCRLGGDRDSWRRMRSASGRAWQATGRAGRRGDALPQHEPAVLAGRCAGGAGRGARTRARGGGAARGGADDLRAARRQAVARANRCRHAGGRGGVTTLRRRWRARR